MNHHISLLLLTKNEQKNIKKNFNWLKQCPAINQIIVIDDYSQDDTKKAIEKILAKNTKLTFKTRKLKQNFSSQRKYGIDQSINNWILWLDADEKPSQKLIDFLNTFQPKETKAYYFNRQNIFWDQKLNYGEGKQNILRLFNKENGYFIGKVHETWHTTASTKNTKYTINHYTNSNISSFLQKINFYTDLRSLELYHQKTKINLFHLITLPIIKFFQNYIFKLGFLDGTPGIIISLLMSLHSFLVRAKLWQLYNHSSST